MKKVYCKPMIQVQSIESENLMENPLEASAGSQGHRVRVFSTRM